MVYLLCRYRSYKNSENTNLICITIKNLQRYLNYISTTTIFSMKNIKFSFVESVYFFQLHKIPLFLSSKSKLKDNICQMT